MYVFINMYICKSDSLLVKVGSLRFVMQFRHILTFIVMYMFVSIYI